MLKSPQDRGVDLGSDRTAIFASGPQALAESRLPAIPVEEKPFSCGKEKRITGSSEYGHILEMLGKRGFIVDQRTSADGTYIDILASSVRAGPLAFLSMPQWSDRTEEMAKGGYKRDLSFVRVSASDSNVYRVLGAVTVNAYKNFSAALKPDGSGFALNVDGDSESRAVIGYFGADGSKRECIKSPKTKGSPGDYDSSSIQIRNLEYDSGGNLWAAFGNRYTDPKWERVTT